MRVRSHAFPFFAKQGLITSPAVVSPITVKRRGSFTDANYISAPQIVDMTDAGPGRCIVLLIYPTALPGVAGSLIMAGDDNGADQDGWSVRMGTAGNIVFQIRNGSTASSGTAKTISGLNRLHCVVIKTFNSSGFKSKMCLDGDNIVQSTHTVAYLSPTGNSGKGLKIGRGDNAGNTPSGIHLVAAAIIDGNVPDNVVQTFSAQCTDIGGLPDLSAWFPQFTTEVLNFQGSSYNAPGTAGVVWSVTGSAPVNDVTVQYVTSDTKSQGSRKIINRLPSEWLGKITDPVTGAVDIEVELKIPTNAVNTPIFWPIRITSDAGDFGLKYTPSDGISTSGKLEMVVRGAINGTQTFDQPDCIGWEAGDTVRFRLWYWHAGPYLNPTIRNAAMKMMVNNVFRIDAGLTTTSASLGTFSNPRIAVRDDNDAVIPAEITNIRTFAGPQHFEWIRPGFGVVTRYVMGDSLTATRAGRTTWPTLWKLSTYTTSQAHGGDQALDQQNVFTSSRWFGDPRILEFWIFIGINDVDAVNPADMTAAIAGIDTVSTAIQTLINTIKASNPTAKIILLKLDPARGYVGQTALEYDPIWKETNKRILGTASSGNLTSIDYRVTQHSDDLNDGTDNLKVIYDTGDGIHQTIAGSVVIGAYTKTQLLAIGNPI